MAALGAAALLALAGCTGSSASSRDEATGSSAAGTSGSEQITGTLTVFAAASLTDVFTELGDQFMDDHPGLEVRFNFAGSSALATQITQGAPADVFASADEVQMAKAGDAGLAVDPAVFAENPLMLVVPADNPLGIQLPGGGGVPSLTEILDHDATMAVCAPQVPCGAAAAKVLDAAGLSAYPDTYEEDVRAVLTKVELGEVDAGLVYVSDVHAAGDKVVAFGFSESFQAINRYPISVLTAAPNPAAAQAFVDLVLSDDGQQTLRDAGFLEP
ncbi:molybdate ABC transporter substrate-binding protein [Blastococcus sp. CT_GayMR16]|nr:molybdate ABC transporter substrate-binding protein [Blastococcus sp. CT_GayMR16]